MWIQNISKTLRIDMDKWRFLRTVVTENKAEHLYVVTFPLRWFTIKNITIDKFISSGGKTGHIDDVETFFLRVAKYCPSCLGWGKLDWVDVARGCSPNRSPLKSDCELFEIDEPVYHYLQGGPTTSSFVTSKPKLHETDRMCKECFGSGISLQQPDGKYFYWNTLGDWYKKSERI